MQQTYDDWILDGETMEADEYMSEYGMHPSGHRGSEMSTDLLKAMELAWENLMTRLQGPACYPKG